MGISPNIIVLRADEKIEEESIFRKIANFCNVKPDCVIENITLPVLYEAPLMLEKEHLSDIICRELNIAAPKPDLTEWEQLVERIKKPSGTDVSVALVGKYTQLHDAYLSVVEALKHAGYQLGAHVHIVWIDAETLTPENYKDLLSQVSGIIVPGGFGSRGIEGMILAARYARTTDTPYLGLCLGMQIATIEFARHVMKYTDANSTEFDQATTHPVIAYVPGQSDEIAKGATMRLGAYPCVIKPHTVMEKCYRTLEISERHRHRYEFNNEFRAEMEKAGLVISGTSPDNSLVETVEVCKHPFYVGVQFHPEFKSRPNKPHPLFVGFVKSAIQKNTYDRY
jgi:CTP synthase